MARPIKGQTFWDRVWIHAEVLENGCIVFNGHRDECGYGRISKDGKLVRIHREVYKYLHPEEKITGVIMHSCDNPACINWEHLSHGTQAENIADMEAKGRRVVLKGEQQHDAKLKNQDVKHIRYLAKTDLSTVLIARHYDVSETVIQKIVKCKTWTHVDGIEENVDLYISIKNLIKNNGRIYEKDIYDIRRKIANGVPCSDIAKEYEVSSKTIRLIRNGKIWTHVK